MKFIRTHIYPLLLLVAVGVLFFTNYKPGTFLLGWDALPTELNPWLSVKRALFSVWEEYQSFGLLAGNAHAADLVRATLVAISSLILPVNLIRYVFHFGMLAVAAMGSYTLLLEALPFKKRNPFLAFTAALFYLFNYATVQLMGVPFEPFTVFLAFLPWNIWIFSRYLHSRNKKTTTHNLALLTALNFLATPQAYVQTVFVVYGFVMLLVSIGEMIGARNRFKTAKRIVLAGVIILAVNAFWLLPQTYFVASGGAETVQNAKINQLSTEDVQLQNQEYATVENLLTFKGFYSGLRDSNQYFLFGSWLDHFNRLPVKLLSWALAGLMFAGMFKRSFQRRSMLLLWSGSTIALLGSSLFANIPLLGQIFRAPFTKFGAVYALSASYFIAFGMVWLLEWLKKYVPKYKNAFAHIFVIAVITGYALPAFQGNYIARDMKIDIPQDYFTTINHFKTVDKNARIALMPDYTFWGWQFKNWGYNGSGFLWYGIEQPMVSRTFDVWSPESEGYFWEMKAAVETEDSDAVEQVLEKYSIDYIIVDKSLRPINSTSKALQYDRLANTLETSERIEQFGFGKYLDLYKVSPSQHKNFVSLHPELQSVGPDVSRISHDRAYEEFGTYVVPKSEAPDVYYPFRDVFSQVRLADKKWTISETTDAFVVTATLPQNVADYTLVVPESEENEGVDVNFTLMESELTATVAKSLVQEIPAPSGVDYECGDGSEYEVFKGDGFVRVFSNNRAVPCVSYDFTELSQNRGYLLNVQTRNLDGQRFFMSFTDQTKDQPYIEDRLISDTAYYVIAPRYEFGRRYTLTLQNNSYWGISSTNVVDRVAAYDFPFDRLTQSRLVSPQAAVHTAGYLSPSNAEKRAYHAYTADLSISDVQSSTFIQLHQAYHPGWHAYVVTKNVISERLPWLFGLRLREDMRINQWSQGWKIDEECDGVLLRSDAGECRVVMVFWPQYLEWIGLVVAGSVLVFVGTRVRKER